MLGTGIRGRTWPWAVPILLGIVLAGLGCEALHLLGFRRVVAMAWIASIAVGGRFNLPLTRLPSASGAMRIGLNVGGALIPLVLAGIQATRLPVDAWKAALAAIVAVAVTSFAIARPVASKGIFVPWLLPGMLAAALALVLAPSSAPAFAFLAAVVGSFIGADLFTLATIVRLGAVRAVLGGDGPYDGLVWTGLLAALLAGQQN